MQTLKDFSFEENQENARLKPGTMASSLKITPEVEEKKEHEETEGLDEFESYSTAFRFIARWKLAIFFKSRPPVYNKFDAKVLIPMEHCAGTHNAQEVLAEKFSSIDHSTSSSGEQGRTKVCTYCALLDEMSHSFDRGLRWFTVYQNNLHSSIG